MSDNRPGAAVNEHYLDKVLALSEEVGVTATEDIYDTNGNKLLAKGAEVSRRLQERLIVHRLRKPIETCIAVEGAVDACRLADCAAQAVDESAALGAILALSGVTGETLRRELTALAFTPPLAMMLTMIDRGDEGGMRHVAEVATLALAFATHAGLGQDVRRISALAGVLHDIGELYINPALVRATHVLAPDEWAHVIVHPHIGRLLIQDLGDCPPAVAVAVAEHHERLNGTGYPRAMVVGQSSTAGQLVAGAELIAGLLHQPNPLQRADMALKVISGEHPRTISALMSQASRKLGGADFGMAAAIDEQEIVQLSERMNGASELAARIARAGTVSPKHLDLLLRTRERLALVQRAFMATGLDMHIAVTEGAQPSYAEVFESELALREISWRVRDIGRDLALQLGPSRTSIKEVESLLALMC
jgi:hypothetical protein